MGIGVVAYLLVGSACGRISYDPLEEGLVNAHCLGAPGGESAIVIRSLDLEYATPNSLRVAWDASLPSGTFSHYEVHLIGAAEAPECPVRRFDSASNPGLAHYTAPQPAGYAIDATTLYGLEPDTPYLVQLLAFDDEGRSTVSGVLEARTGPASTAGAVLFSEEDTAGYSIPGDMQLASGEAFGGSQYYEFVSQCIPSCFENLRRQDIDVSLAGMSSEDFETAYYEFALSASTGEHSYWSQVRLSFTQADGSNELFAYAPFVLRADGEYQVHQFPLKALLQEFTGDPLRHDQTRDGVFEFTVGGTWPLGQTVRLDELQIRW